MKHTCLKVFLQEMHAWNGNEKRIIKKSMIAQSLRVDTSQYLHN